MRKLKSGEKTIVMTFNAPISFRKVFADKARESGRTQAEILRSLADKYVSGQISFKDHFKDDKK